MTNRHVNSCLQTWPSNAQLLTEVRTMHTEPHGDDTPDSDELVAERLAAHESIAASRRTRKLRQTGHRCSICGSVDLDRGGQARVLVQRIESDPDQCEPDDIQNLTTACVRCLHWIGQMPTRDDLPTTIETRLNGIEPDSDQVAILNYVYRNGPAAPHELLELIEGDHRKLHSKLDELRSLDATNPDISEPVLVKNRVEREYGLPEQIPAGQRARGHIPLDPDERRSRILDAFALRLDEVLPDNEMKRERIARAVDRSGQNVHLMIQRAHADQFPFADWADSHASRRTDLSVTEAIDLTAKSTTNVSRRLVGDTVADLLERNGEEALATDIRDWIHGDKTTASASDESEPDSAGVIDESSHQYSDPTPLRDIDLARRPDNQSIDRTVVVDDDGIARLADDQENDSQ